MSYIKRLGKIEKRIVKQYDREELIIRLQEAHEKLFDAYHVADMGGFNDIAVKLDDIIYMVAQLIEELGGAVKSLGRTGLRKSVETIIAQIRSDPRFDKFTDEELRIIVEELRKYTEEFYDLVAKEGLLYLVLDKLGLADKCEDNLDTILRYLPREVQYYLDVVNEAYPRSQVIDNIVLSVLKVPTVETDAENILEDYKEGLDVETRIGGLFSDLVLFDPYVYSDFLTDIPEFVEVVNEIVREYGDEIVRIAERYCS